MGTKNMQNRIKLIFVRLFLVILTSSHVTFAMLPGMPQVGQQAPQATTPPVDEDIQEAIAAATAPDAGIDTDALLTDVKKDAWDSYQDRQVLYGPIMPLFKIPQSFQIWLLKKLSFDSLGKMETPQLNYQNHILWNREASKSVTAAHTWLTQHEDYQKAHPEHTAAITQAQQDIAADTAWQYWSAGNGQRTAYTTESVGTFNTQINEALTQIDQERLTEYDVYLHGRDAAIEQEIQNAKNQVEAATAETAVGLDEAREQLEQLPQTLMQQMSPQIAFARIFHPQAAQQIEQAINQQAAAIKQRMKPMTDFTEKIPTKIHEMGYHGVGIASAATMLGRLRDIHIETGIRKQDIADTTALMTKLAPDFMLARYLQTAQSNFTTQQMIAHCDEIISLIERDLTTPTPFSAQSALYIYIQKNQATSLFNFRHSLAPAALQWAAHAGISHCISGPSAIENTWGGTQNVVYKKDANGKRIPVAVNSLGAIFYQDAAHTGAPKEEFEYQGQDSPLDKNIHLFVSPVTLATKAVHAALSPLGLRTGILAEALTFADMTTPLRLGLAIFATPKLQALHQKLRDSSAQDSQQFALKTIDLVVRGFTKAGPALAHLLVVKSYNTQLRNEWALYATTNKPKLLALLKNYHTAAAQKNQLAEAQAAAALREFVSMSHRGKSTLQSLVKTTSGVPSSRFNVLLQKHAIGSFALLGGAAWFAWNLL